MSNRKSILLLGGSRQQVVAIEKAKELGFRTVLCDYLPDNPGIEVADVFYQESTTDREKILQIARSERVSGVLAYSSDPAAPTAAYVAEELGLPTNPLRSVEIMSSKRLFREFLRAHGFASPQFLAIREDDLLEDIEEYLSRFSFPIVVKPTDSSGSKGVSVLVDIRDLSAALDYALTFSRNRLIIAEEFIQFGFPEVVGGDIFVVDRKVEFWGLMSCLRSSSGNDLIPVGKKTPSGLSDNQLMRVRAEIARLVTTLEIEFGELNVEVIVGVDGIINILEIGARAGGNMIPIQLSDASGIDLVGANIQCAMGHDPGDITWDGGVSNACHCTYVLHSEKTGLFEAVEIGSELTPFLYRQVMYVEEGDLVEIFDGANKALGILFFKFEEYGQMMYFTERIDAYIQVSIGDVR